MQKIKNMFHHSSSSKDDKPTHSGLFHHHHETAPSHTVVSEPVPAASLVAKQEVHDELLTRKDEVLVHTEAPLMKAQSVNLLGEGEVVTKVALEEPTVAVLSKEPVTFQKMEKDVVVHEHIHPVEKEEIQPIIHREREQLEVRQVTEMLHETEIAPTVVEKRELAPEVREVVVEKAAPIMENVVLPTVEVDATLKTQVVHAPIVNEVVKKTIIEEVQPVLEKDVIVPTLVQQVQPIYEKIVEAPVVVREELPMKEITKVESDMLKGKSIRTTEPLVL